MENMNKISVGEYVRINGKIAIVIKRDADNHIVLDIKYRGDNWLTIFEEALIKKHSKSIAELLEIGDYVNGVRILDITGDYIHTAEWDCCKSRLESKLHSIVTKEQMQEMEYRL